MSEVVIRADGLGKQYRLGERAGYQTVRERINYWVAAPWRSLRRAGVPDAARAGDRQFWALRDVSFEVRRGEVVGIIGRNGAGKSTLLKILSRITEPTEGQADLCGRVGSLLEVGTGFHPELTGRENIFLNGAILGMRRGEIARKFDEIAAFAEVEQFIDTPVKYYSSGMYLRLGFAVAAHLEPEILVIDEVLAVGDAGFQKKCLGKMGEVARGGRTVLFVSHNMAAVRNLCHRGVLLGGGRIQASGPTGTVVQTYLKSTQGTSGQFTTSGRRLQPANAEIVSARLEKDGMPVDCLIFGDRADVVLRIRVAQSLRFHVELVLRQQDGVAVAFAPGGLMRDWAVDATPGEITVRCQLPPARLASGAYSVDLITAVSGSHCFDYLESGLSFVIDSAAIGERNWPFSQGRGQGHTLWDVEFSTD
jgi:lipopolysaccharide transport system ATP-binding protein